MSNRRSKWGTTVQPGGTNKGTNQTFFMCRRGGKGVRALRTLLGRLSKKTPFFY